MSSQSRGIDKDTMARNENGPEQREDETSELHKYKQWRNVEDGHLKDEGF